MAFNNNTVTLKRILIFSIIVFLITILIYFHESKFSNQIFTENNDIWLPITNAIQQQPLSTNINLQLLWKCLFYHYILYPKFLSSLNISTIRIQNECNIYRDNISSYNIEHFLQLTNTITITQNLTHRDYVSLRRYIMLITNTLNINSNKMLHSILQTLHTIHNESQQNINNALSRQEKKYFLIHVVKSGGSTVCRTFNALGFNTTKPEIQNCNIRRTNSAFKSPDWGSVSCQQYLKEANEKRLELLAYERNMHGHRLSAIPTLCDQFVYILPFRQPLKRIYSFLDQRITQQQRQPTDFVVRRTILAKDATERQIKNCIEHYIMLIGEFYHKSILHPPQVCTMKIFDVIDAETGQHIIYTPPYLASDLNGFFENLYMNELAEDVLTKINLTAKYHDIDGFHCGREPGTYKLYWFGSDRYNKFAFKVAMNWSWAGQRIEKFNFDFMKGWITNLYTRSFGYNHSENEIAVTYDAFYARNDEIGIADFVNSVFLMMNIDYILPFEDSFNHSVWQYLFNIIESKHGNRSAVKYWLHANKGSHYSQSQPVTLTLTSRMEWINSKNIEVALGKEEKELLRNKNKLDMLLYEMANNIANVDMLFYESISEHH